MHDTALIVFARAPVPGQAKTRLAPALGGAGAAALAERMLQHTMDAALAAGPAALELCVSPDASHPGVVAQARRPGVGLSLQGEGDLGLRMQRVLMRLLQAHPQALLVGTDAPALDGPMLQSAVAALHTHDAAFVPTVDGGYVAIGLRRGAAEAARAVFEHMTWSTPEVMAETRRRLAAAGLRWAELPPVADIDEPADLVHLPPGWLHRLHDPHPG